MNIGFSSRVRSFFKNEHGASMVEYGVALLVVTAIGVTLMTTLGDEVEENVQAACTSLNDATACPTG